MAAALLTLSACRSPSVKADAYEANYDRLLNRKAYGPALESIQRAVAVDENEPRRWLKLAHMQDLLNHPAAAAASYQRALDLQPYNIEALENLAVLSVRGGRYDLAKRYIDPLLLLAPDDLAGLLASGAVAIYEKRYADAEALAAKIITSAPDREEGYILRARVYELTNRRQQGIRLLEQRQQASPDNRDLPVELMATYRRLGDRNGIRRTAIRLMEMFPNDPRYVLESARAYHAMKRDDDARRIIAQLAERQGRNISVMTAIAVLWRDIEPRAVAVNKIEAAAAKSPLRVRSALADILTAMGEPARAAALLAPVASTAVAVDNVDAQASYLRAIRALGRTDEVQRKVDEILDFDQDNPVALLMRARIRLARGEYLEAATDAGVVASQDESNEEAALLVAQIYAAQGNTMLADKSFSEARDQFPDSPGALRSQMDWLLRQNRANDAVEQAASYARRHGRQFEGWRIYRDVCVTAKNATCAADAQRELATFTSRAGGKG